MLWAQDAPRVPEVAKDPMYWYIGGGVVALAVVVFLLKAVFGGKKAHNPEGGLGENLKDYPPAPANTSSRRLTLNGMPVRVRLVIVAPVGKQHANIGPDDVPEILDELFRGMPAVLKADKPRIKVWPPQLSVAGFAPTFHRLIKSPEAPGVKSRWVLVAGATKVGGKPLLLGMALHAEESNKLGLMTLEGQDWVDSLRVER